MKYILTLSLLLFTFFANSQTNASKKNGQQEFEVTFVGNSGGTLRLSQAKIGSGIIVRIIGSDDPVSILSFELGIAKGGQGEEATSFGSLLSSKQKELISKLTLGSNLYISAIKIKLADGSTKKLKGISFKIN